MNDSIYRIELLIPMIIIINNWYDVRCVCINIPNIIILLGIMKCIIYKYNNMLNTSS